VTGADVVEVAVVQHDIVWRDAAATIARVAPRVAEAADAGADLIVLPETFSVGFTARFAADAERPDGPSVTFLRGCADRFGVWVAGSVMLQDAGDSRPSNTLVLAGPAGQMHTYRKIHTSFFDDERAQVAPGENLVTVTIGGLRCTLFICYDLRFANVFWRAAPATDCFLVVANWPTSRQAHWDTLLRARAIENQAYVVAANRVGRSGGGELFGGGSTVIDPAGQILCRGGEQEEVLVAELDPRTVADLRRRLPFLEHRVAGTGLSQG
jgi:predicted amidohydrolase